MVKWEGADIFRFLQIYSEDVTERTSTALD